MERIQLSSESSEEILISKMDIDESPFKLEPGEQLDYLPPNEPFEEVLVSEIEIEEHPIKPEPEENELDCLSQNDDDTTSEIIHRGEVTKKSNLTCNECFKKYYRPEMLAWHIENCHGSNPTIKVINVACNQQHFQCVLCKKEFKKILPIIQHLYYEHQLAKLPYHCNNCNRQFMRRENLLTHQSVCNGGPFGVNHTDNSRQTADEIETGEQAFGLGLGQDWSSSRVLPVNEGRRPHLQCDECGAIYTHAEMLTCHIENCHGINPRVKIIKFGPNKQRYQCIFCNTEFKTLNLVMFHLRKKHQLGKLPYKCEICNTQFTKMTGLRRHGKISKKCKLIASNACAAQVEYFDDQLENSQQISEKIKIDEQIEVENFEHMGEEIEIDEQEKRLEPRDESASKNTLQIPKSKSLHCAQCGISFTYPEMLAWHTENFHGSNPTVKFVKIGDNLAHFQCTFCQSMHIDSYDVIRHLKYQHQINKLPFQCQNCKKEVLKGNDFIRHQLRCKKKDNAENSAHTENIDYQTKSIPETAESCVALETEEQEITLEQEESQLDCLQQNSPIDVTTLSKHRAKNRFFSRHLKCDECGAGYAHPEMLTWHIKYCHGSDAIIKVLKIGERSVKYQCSLCVCETTRMEVMIRHLSFSHEIRNLPFICSICHESYFTKTLFNSHLCKNKNNESRGYPYKCKQCGNETNFLHAEMLDWHIENCHGDNRTLNIVKIDDQRGYQCVFCQNEFKKLPKAISHLQSMHQFKKLPFHCNICNYKQFSKWFKLEQHKLLCMKKKRTAQANRHIEMVQPVFEEVLLPAIKLEPGDQLDLLPQIPDVKSPMESKHLECRVLVPKLLECDFCCFYSDSKTQLATHMQLHLKPNTLDVATNERRVSLSKKCQRCDIIYSHPEMLTWHNQNCHGPDAIVKIIKLGYRKIRYQCIFCKTKFTHMVSIIQHLFSEHRSSNLPFHCTVCKKPFILYKNLMQHQVKCTKIKNYSVGPIKLFTQKHNVKCKLCDALFETGLKLQNHLSNVHAMKRRRFACCHCKKSYTVLPHFKSHCDKKHPGKPMFQCDVCMTRFASYGGYRKHKSYTHKAPVFRCKICDATFNYPASLQAHIKNIHSQKMLSCNLCSRKFKCEHYLRLHVKKHHSGRIFDCEHCEYSTRFRDRLIYHLTSYH